MSDELRLDFTGKMSIVLELVDYQPIAFHINDMDAVKDAIGIILRYSDHSSSVKAQTKAETRRLKKILEDIE